MLVVKLNNYRQEEKRELANVATKSYRDFIDDFCPHIACQNCKFKYLCDDLRRLCAVATQKANES